MSEEFYINLTLATYRVTGLFSEKEPLKCDIRKKANEILIGLLCDNYKGLIENIKTLDSLLAVAASRGLADKRNFLVLRREYAKIQRPGQDGEVAPVRKPAVRSSFRKPKKRKEEIIDILRANGRVRVGDLARTFPGLNRRTLLRDLDSFCQVGTLIKSGNGRGACYTVKNATL
jgi:hypothetical protein